MGSRNWWAVVVGAVLPGVWMVWQSASSGLAAPAPGATRPAADATAVPMAGRASCSGRACHGGIEPSAGNGIQQNEFVTWLSHDKHARAYDVLNQERARRMAKNLGIESAAKDSRCLACHTTPQLAGNVAEELVALRSDGVSCEACHGLALGTDPWITAHTLATWGKDGKAKEESYHKHGMTPLFDLEVQAQTCAGCHVGAPADPEHGIPARDLNHDLMAAGHPRLTFELGTFRANMPPHWRPELHVGQAGYEASVWSVGQVVSAKASMELLAHRAKEARAGTAPWPEFAEASCFACHADLRNPSWRRNPDYYSGRKPGAIPVNRWFTVLLPALNAVAKEQVAAAAKASAELAAEMEKPYPDAAKVESLATTARTALAELSVRAKATVFDPAKSKEVAGGLAQMAEALKEPDWDDLTQLALAAAALNLAAGKTQASPVLDDVFIRLAYPPMYESPEGYSPRAKTGDKGADLKAALLQSLQELAR